MNLLWLNKRHPNYHKSKKHVKVEGRGRDVKKDLFDLKALPLGCVCARKKGEIQLRSVKFVFIPPRPSPSLNDYYPPPPRWSLPEATPLEPYRPFTHICAYTYLTLPTKLYKELTPEGALPIGAI